jgi:hypothetical protein
MRSEGRRSPRSRFPLFNPKIALEGGDKEFYQDATDAKQRPSKQISRNGCAATAGLAKTGMEGTWQAGRD